MRLETQALPVFLLSFTVLCIWPSESRFYLLTYVQTHSKVVTFPTAISRKVGKSTRDNPERYVGGFE